MPQQDPKLLKKEAQKRARSELGDKDWFLALSKDEQFPIYRNKVNKIHQELVQKQKQDELDIAQAMTADDQIDDRHLENRRIDQEGALAGNVLRQVDFPQFVKDLLKGVFDANLNVVQEQMDSYAELVDRITQPASKFINTIDNATAYAFMAERQPDRFQLMDTGGSSQNLLGGNQNLLGNTSNGGGGNLPGNQTTNTQMQLADKDGNPIEEEDIRGEILQAKLQLVRQHQQLLEEMLLMGVTRLVVDHGKVKASVDFKIDAREQIQKADRAQEQMRKIRQTRFGLGGAFSFFGGGVSSSNTKTKIQISTAQAASVGGTEESTKVHGEVEINFKSDYFPLENFRDILTQNQPQNKQQQQNQQDQSSS